MSSLPIRTKSPSDAESTIRFLQDELAATNHEVMALTLELEERVAARTAELLESNRALEKEIAERKHAEEEIRLLNHDLEQRALQLEAANHDLEAFSYSVSHDLRSPLRHIIGFAEVLEEDEAPRLSEEGKQHLERIRKAGFKMSSLIDDLLHFARYSRVELNATDVDMNKLVAEVLDDLEPDLKGRTVHWKIDQFPPVSADPGLLRQVVVNLISNALKYSSKRAISKIEIGCKQAPRETLFWVRDNGVGFDQTYAKKLFVVFERLHNQEQFEGAGVGLATVRKIVSRHGGRTWAEGKVDQGATFYFTLPLKNGS